MKRYLKKLTCTISITFLIAGCGWQYKRESILQPYTAEELAKVRLTMSGRLIPDHNGIVYICDKTGARELWHRPVNGQLRQLTNLKEKVVNPRVSPDGKNVVFASDYGGNERYDLFRIDLTTKKIWSITKTKNISEFEHRFSPNGDQLVLLADPEIPFRPQVFLMNIDTGEQVQLTKGDTPVWEPIWSHDGKYIAATRTGDWQNGELLIISTSDSTVKEIKPLSDGYILWPKAFSPDGSSLLALTKNEKGFQQLAHVEIKTGRIKRIGPAQWDVVDVVWNIEAGIFFTRNISGRYGLYRMLTPGGELKEVIAPHGVISELQIDKEGSYLLFSREEATQPSEIYLYEISTSQLQQLTCSLPEDIDSKRLSVAKPFKVVSFDGIPIEGFMYEPCFARLGKPYPAVAVIHGGPDDQSIETFDPLAQALTQYGFTVIQPNYRGSTGYGKLFEDLNNKDWGGGDRKDIRSVLEHFVADGLIDRDRIGITGGSYGGYMTLMTLVKDPDFYAAGVEAFGMHDLTEDYEITKDRFGLWYETEMGTPQQNPELFVNRSPIRFLDQLRAPLLIFQGANDTNVPKVESDKVVEILRKTGRKVQYVIYEDEGHGFTRRKSRVDNMKRTIDFFRKHLGTKDKAQN